ncbi:MAG: EscU/YscU/HrcU family type III secretion system export apparatus switch protein [Alphaproteobacteria bacterium]|nr:EscU/YscU/HrcU family type III secretion system export apparatus switch protein [Alphaproteobacteria bacterium]
MTSSKKDQDFEAIATRKLAVALDHDRDNNRPPEVIASGKGAFAEKILEIAFANDVKVREDADLAEVLQALEIGDEIPLEAFAAVSEILTYVYRANGEEVPIDIGAGLSKYQEARK